LANVSIAIVEDDEPLREALYDLLRSYDYSPSTYGSAEEFLLRGSPRQTDCIILDQDLPGLSGAELQQQLASLNSRAAVVFLSACRDPAVRLHALSSGARHFLSKSADADDIIQTILSVIKSIESSKGVSVTDNPSSQT